MSKERKIKFAEAIREATLQSMRRDPSVVLMGLGADDPKGIFGTTTDLHLEFGPTRVFDTPVSENGMTGIAVGAATMGLRPVLTHQRVDFALLSFDQIMNNAAKWHFMFSGQLRAPITIRMVIGRGWGQGPQHSQSLQALFAHIPGLKVVMPANPKDAKGLLMSSIRDDSPVIFLEHRWLHNVIGEVPEGEHFEELGKAKVVREGKDVTIVASSYMVLEAYRAAGFLSQLGIEAEVIDLRTIQPLDHQTILKSVEKTGQLLVTDTGHTSFGIGAEVVARVTENSFGSLKKAPVRVCSPDFPVPTSSVLSQNYYPRAIEIFEAVIQHFAETRSEKEEKQVTQKLMEIEKEIPSDVPDMSFSGPF